MHFPEGRVDLATCEVGAKAEMNSASAVAHVGIRVARDVEHPWIGEDGLITVGRGVPHRDLVSSGHFSAAEFHVGGERTAHVDDRRRPPHDLLDSRSAQAVEIVPPPLSLFGITRQGEHTVADGVAGGLDTGPNEQVEERRNLGGGQPFTIYLRLNQARRQVISWSAAPVVGEGLAIVADASQCARVRVHIGCHLRISESEDLIGQLKELLVVLLRYAHHVADHLQRKGTR